MSILVLAGTLSLLPTSRSLHAARPWIRRSTNNVTSRGFSITPSQDNNRDEMDNISDSSADDTDARSRSTSVPAALTKNPFRLAVMRLGVTELRATSRFNYGKYDGVISCGYCGAFLFDSASKYNSGSGWPSFLRSIKEDAISYSVEMDGRLECQCAKCKSHLGHVFLDGPSPNTVEKALLTSSPKSDPRDKSNRYLPRFCVNGAAMDFLAR